MEGLKGWSRWEMVVVCPCCIALDASAACSGGLRGA